MNARPTPDSEANMIPSIEESTATRFDTVPAHEDATHLKVPVESPGGAPKLGILFALALLMAIGYGLYRRHANETTLQQATNEAAVPNVSVVHPAGGSKAGDLSLPGNVQAFTEAPIYSRTNGYLKKWYFDIGSHVRTGQLLAVIETPEVDQQLNQSRAELERMQANEQLAGTTSTRWQALLAKHAVSQQEADQARSNYIAAQAAVDASKANVHRLEQLQNYERIVAPFDGVITARNTDIGDLIDAGSGTSSPRELFHLAAISKLRVYAAVPEVDADAMHNGDTAYLTEDSSPDEKIPGKVVRNSNAIDHVTRTLNVEVDVDNSAGRLRPGAYVFVHFHLPAGSTAVTVPSNALLFRSEGLRVAVVRDGRVHLLPVTIGRDYGNAVEITSGLSSDDNVILDPSDSLADDAQVHAQPAHEGGRK